MFFKKFLDKTRIKASEMVNEAIKEGTKMTVKDFEPIIKVGLLAIGLLAIGAQRPKESNPNAPIIIYNYCNEPGNRK